MKNRARWFEAAYDIGNHDGIKYDKDWTLYGIDGQSLCSYFGLVWARYIGDFLDNSKVGLNVMAQRPNHREAELQLAMLYGLLKDQDGLEPFEVFRKFL